MVSESVGSRSDGGKEFHSLGAQAAKLRGPNWTCGILALASHHEQQSVDGGNLYMHYSCNWNAQLLEVLRSSLMATLEEDRLC